MASGVFAGVVLLGVLVGVQAVIAALVFPRRRCGRMGMGMGAVAAAAAAPEKFVDESKPSVQEMRAFLLKKHAPPK
jgi:hypothetical protein